MSSCKYNHPKRTTFFILYYFLFLPFFCTSSCPPAFQSRNAHPKILHSGGSQKHQSPSELDVSAPEPKSFIKPLKSKKICENFHFFSFLFQIFPPQPPFGSSGNPWIFRLFPFFCICFKSFLPIPMVHS